MIGAGYLLRFLAPVPEIVRDGAGGAAYVVAAALGVAAIAPHLRARTIAAAGFALTSAVEVLQLWHPAWLESLRATLPGRLVLGTTFSWGDFPAYGFGAIMAWCLIAALQRFRLGSNLK